MALITGGRVAYRRTIQPEPYESITAEVEFQFTAEEDEDPSAAAAEVLRLAKTEVHGALNLRKKPNQRE